VRHPTPLPDPLCTTKSESLKESASRHRPRARGHAGTRHARPAIPRPAHRRGGLVFRMAPPTPQQGQPTPEAPRKGPRIQSPASADTWPDRWICPGSSRPPRACDLDTARCSLQDVIRARPHQIERHLMPTHPPSAELRRCELPRQPSTARITRLTGDQHATLPRLRRRRSGPRPRRLPAGRPHAACYSTTTASSAVVQLVPKQALTLTV
jgi:hypothetical protein